MSILIDRHYRVEKKNADKWEARGNFGQESAYMEASMLSRANPWHTYRVMEVVADQDNEAVHIFKGGRDVIRDKKNGTFAHHVQTGELKNADKNQ